jgi:hypothetical protein
VSTTTPYSERVMATTALDAIDSEDVASQVADELTKMRYLSRQARSLLAGESVIDLTTLQNGRSAYDRVTNG